MSFRIGLYIGIWLLVVSYLYLQYEKSKSVVPQEKDKQFYRKKKRKIKPLNESEDEK